MDLEKLYFYTITIKDWLPLLKGIEFKQIILNSIDFLSKKGLIKVYGFVIMPNHIHLIWEMLELNGKELPSSSFLKFTSHQFLKTLRTINLNLLKSFEVEADNKAHLFWQSDSLAIEVYSPEVIYQKLDYIHNNPCQKKLMLVNDPLDYSFSSFDFYENGRDRFGFLNHIGDRL